MKGKKIVLGITGSIAAYKAAILIRALIKKGAEVQVVITPAGKEFITPITLSALRIPERCVEMHRDSSGRPRLTNFDWYQLAYDGRLYRVGRLQLEFPLAMPNAYRLFENKSGDTVALANMQVHKSGIPLGS